MEEPMPSMSVGRAKDSAIQQAPVQEVILEEPMPSMPAESVKDSVIIQETGKVKLLNGNEYDCVVENGEPLLISTIGYVRKVFIFLDFINLRTEHRLMNFTRNGELVYEYTEPLGAELGIESAAKDGGFGEDIYTLQGVRLNGRDVSGLPKGIYIRGGKKYLVR